MSSYFVNALFSKNSNSESWNSDYGLAHDLGSTSSASYGYGAGGTIQQPHPTQLTVLYNGTSLFKTAHQHQLNPCVLSLPMGNLYHAHDVIQRPTFYASHNRNCIQYSDYHLKSTEVANDSVCAEQCSSLPDLFPWMKPQGESLTLKTPNLRIWLTSEKLCFKWPTRVRGQWLVMVSKRNCKSIYDVRKVSALPDFLFFSF